MTDAAEVGRRPLLVVVPVAAAASSQNEMLKERTNMLLSKYWLWTSALFCLSFIDEEWKRPLS